MASIDIAGVRKSFGHTAVLKGVDLAVADGEFVVLVGPSGCGKSTLLRLVAGLEEASAGDIRIGGRLMNDVPPRDRDIAMVFQSYALYPHMSVRDNMSYALRLRRVAADRIAAAVAGASRKLGLDSLVDRKPRALSGGQRQRVAMGRAIVRHPQAFLFDEPLSNLDARLREQMRYEIRRLHRDLGATSIYVTHDQIEAMTMADRIVAMSEGVAQQIGTPAELYHDPANAFVAGFIGSPAMNFLPATLAPVGEGGRADIRIGGASLGTVPVPAGAAPGASVTVGLRPERIRIGPVDSGAPAIVDLLEPTGLGVVLHLLLGAQPLKVFTTDRMSLSGAEPVGLAVEPADLLLFDPATGARLRL